MRNRILRQWLVGLVVCVLTGGVGIAILPTARGTEPQGPVTIVTAIDFSSFPFHGTFAVTEGSTILGCSKGSFMDSPIGGIGSEVQKGLTCTGGAGKGDTFTFLFDSAIGSFTGGRANGHWRVLEGTGFFKTLKGEGDFSVAFCFGPDPCPGFLPPPSGIETITGTVHFE